MKAHAPPMPYQTASPAPERSMMAPTAPPKVMLARMPNTQIAKVRGFMGRPLARDHGAFRAFSRAWREHDR